MYHGIENCGWRFAFQCPRRWEGLREVGEEGVRICEACLKRVYLCKSEEEVKERARVGDCVAIEFMRDGDLNGLLGRVMEE